MPYDPRGPGWKSGETSAAAAADMAPKAATLRGLALAALHDAGVPLTADEVAARLRLDRLSIRPRLTELRNAGLVRDSGERGRTDAGKRAVKWAPVSGCAP